MRSPAIDVGNEHRGGVGVRNDTIVHEVVEVDLGGAPAPSINRVRAVGAALGKTAPPRATDAFRVRSMKRAEIVTNFPRR